jgi:acetyl-CoA carboxylase carboxyl transferase subunit beta
MAPRWFGKKSKTASRVARQSADALPDGLWTKCPQCSEILFNKELEKNLRVCSKCGHHYKLSARARLEFTVDPGSFQEFASELTSVNPLGFPEYEIKLEKGKRNSGLEEAMVVGKAEIGGYPIVIGVADPNFMAGSMGSVLGEKVVRAAETAVDEGLPLILFATSGGARMQEGILALMQMAKTSAAIAKVMDAGLPYIAIHTDPTTAGVLASFAMLGDIIIAEPGALIGFAGARVAAQAQVVNVPPNFQKAEFQLENGMIDMILHRKKMRPTLIKILDLCSKENGNAA